MTIEGGDPAEAAAGSPPRARRGCTWSILTARSRAGRRRASWSESRLQACRFRSAAVCATPTPCRRRWTRAPRGSIVGTAALYDSARSPDPARRAARRRGRCEGRAGRRRRLGDRDRGDRRAHSRSAAPRRGGAVSSSRARAGTARSPDPTRSSLADVLEAGLPVLAAGGIASLDDLPRCVTSVARALSSAAPSGRDGSPSPRRWTPG